jgi:uncharacterized protein
MQADPFDRRGMESFDLIRDVMIPMRDGTRLATDLYLPVTDEPVPAIVERTGYAKEKSPIHWTRSAEYFASRGFAVAIQDVRGIHGSEGRYYPWLDDGWGENQDGYDTIEWLADQDWCSGRVGMFGGSYSGATQLRAAAASPPHLSALVVRQPPASPLQSIRPNGVFSMTEGGGWIVEQTRQALLQAVRQLESVQNLDSESFFRAFPTTPFHDQTQWVRDYLTHDWDDAFWDDWDLVDRAGSITVPILHFGGWYDLHRRSSVWMYQACQRDSPASAHQRLVMGPWIHGSRTHADETGRHVGSIDMGPEAKVDMNALSLQWFDHWLRDRDNGIMDRLPPVRYFLMGAGEWRNADTWPPAGAETVVLHAAFPNLSMEPPSEEGRATFVDRHSDPARTLGGDAVLTVRDEHWDPGDDPGAAASAARQRQRGPQDQTSQEHKGLIFTSELLAEPLTIAGPVRASVSVEVTGAHRPSDAAIVVRLSDVYPDGRSIDLVDGACRLRHNDAPTAVDLGDTAVTIAAGHRLRMGIFGSNFPRVPLRTEAGDLELTVSTGPSHPTKMEISVLPTRGNVAEEME